MNVIARLLMEARPKNRSRKWGSSFSHRGERRGICSLLPRHLTMATDSSQQKRRANRAFPALGTLIQTLEVAKVACVFPPAQAAIGSTSALLMIIKVPFLLLYCCGFSIRVHSGIRGQ